MPRVSSTQHSLPPNPEYREIPRSDGDTRTWPRNTTRIVEGGQVNYMHHVEIDESVAIKWRVMIGDALSKALYWPGESSACNYPSDSYNRSQRALLTC